jgi:hypothetical protein
MKNERTHFQSGEEPSMDDLISFCKEELLNKESARKIGFTAQ